MMKKSNTQLPRTRPLPPKDGNKLTGADRKQSRKGVPNKTTRQVKEALNECYEQLGGVKGMVLWAKRNSINRGEFYKLWIKLLPHQLQVAGANGRDLFAQFAKAVQDSANDTSDDVKKKR